MQNTAHTLQNPIKLQGVPTSSVPSTTSVVFDAAVAGVSSSEESDDSSDEYSDEEEEEVLDMIEDVSYLSSCVFTTVFSASYMAEESRQHVEGFYEVTNASTGS